MATLKRRLSIALVLVIGLGVHLDTLERASADPPVAIGLHRTTDRLVDSSSPPLGSVQLGSCATTKADATLTELREYNLGSSWLYTTHVWEPFQIPPTISNNGDVVCHVYSNPAPRRVPLHRLSLIGQPTFFYSTCDAEVADKVDSGWLYQGVEGFLLDEGRNWCQPLEAPNPQPLLQPTISTSTATACATTTASDVLTCDYTVTMTINGVTKVAEGQISYPTDESINTLLVYGHGCCRASSPNEVPNMLSTFAPTQTGYAIVAMDYRGSGYWDVRAGAQDLIAATFDLQDNLDALTGEQVDITQTVLWGASMGGEATGIALSARPDLFDYWVDTFGVTNLFEEWAALTVRGTEHPPMIEAEAGGKPYEVSATASYLELSPAFQAASMARATVTTSSGVKTSRLKRVFFSHGVGDKVVPYSQSRQMASALIAHGVPVSFHTVLAGDCPSAGCVPSWSPADHDGNCQRAMYPSCWDIVAPLVAGESLDDCPVAEWTWFFEPGSDADRKIGGCVPSV